MKEEQKYFIMSTILFVIIAIIVLQIDKYHDNKVNDNYIVNTNKIDNQYINVNDFGIYLQNKSNKSLYDKKEGNEYPTQGYVLNEDRTICYDYHNKEVKGQVHQTDDGNISLETTTSIYCQMYFDIDEDAPVIKTFKINGSEGSKEGYTLTRNVKYSLTWEDEDVTKYCIQSTEDSDTCEWIKKEELNTYSIPLQQGDGEKTMYAFIKDKANNISEVKSAEITLDETNPTASMEFVYSSPIEIEVRVSGEDRVGIDTSRMYCKEENGEEVQADEDGSCVIDSGLDPGQTYTIEAYVYDLAGRKSDIVKENYSTTKESFSGNALNLIDYQPAGLNTSETLGGLYRFQGQCNAKDGGCTGIVDNFIIFGYDSMFEWDLEDVLYRIIGIDPVSGDMKIVKNSAYTTWWGGVDESPYAESSPVMYDIESIYYKLEDSSSMWRGYVSDTNILRVVLDDSIDVLEPEDLYNYERLTSYPSSSTWEFGVGLLYPSDYVWSSGKNVPCGADNLSDCKASWMHISNNGIGNLDSEWTAFEGPPGFDYEYNTSVSTFWGITKYGNLSNLNQNTVIGLRPVMTVHSPNYSGGVVISDGKGTQEFPFVVIPY